MNQKDINLELYKVFFHVANTLSFSKAAKLLYISQSAVSQNINVLEQRLDTKLFIRSTKKVSLTVDGKSLLRYIEPALNLIENGQNQISDINKLNSGKLHIGASDTICRYYLIDYLKKFHQVYPNITIQVTNRTSIECVYLLEQGHVDLIITNLPNDYITNNMVIQPVKQFHDVFVGNDEFSHLFGDTISIETLIKHPILMLERNTTTSEYIHKKLNSLGFDLKPDVELGSIDLLIDMAKIGIGISFVPDYCLLEASNLTIIPIDNILPARQLGIITNKNTPISNSSKIFIKMLL
ncbi:MAG: LysR family transcriptional regulator [Vallitaleaceae bacterium]|jgi:DNA-binding transcriptional LysR family regulator|nr:LysR family transcriptional regulator [Vallitaleaceae bacterium]